MMGLLYRGSCVGCGRRAELSDDGRCVSCYDLMVDKQSNNAGKKEAQRRWVLTNKEERAEYRRKWYRTNRTRVLAQQAEYRAQQQIA